MRRSPATGLPVMLFLFTTAGADAPRGFDEIEDGAKPVVALLTDLWPSGSQPIAGPFVRDEVAAVGRFFRHVVLVPRLRMQRAHELIWGNGATHGWQRGWLEAAAPSRVVTYPMARIPKGSERRARALGAQWALARAGERPALVHGHFLHGVGPAAVELGRKLGVPVVLTAHGSDARWLVDGGIQERVRREMRMACLDADALVTVSDAMARKLATSGLAVGRMRTIPMGVDAAAFAPRDRALARAELRLDPAARIVLFLGLALEAKGFRVLEEAIERLEHVECIAVGGGPLTAERVRSVGAVPHEQVASWLAAADVVCLPSFAEGMPVSIAEALAAARPVVASRVGGIPEQIEDGANGFLVDPGDVDQLERALRHALSRQWSPDELRRTSRRFWWSTVAGEIAALYSELLA